MEYGYPALNGIITDPTKALDAMLEAYWHSDTAVHSINLPTASFRADAMDFAQCAERIRKALDAIIGAYFTVYTVEVSDEGSSGKSMFVELSLSVTDGGKTITHCDVIELEDGRFKGIVTASYL